MAATISGAGLAEGSVMSVQEQGLMTEIIRSLDSQRQEILQKLNDKESTLPSGTGTHYMGYGDLIMPGTAGNVGLTPPKEDAAELTDIGIGIDGGDQNTTENWLSYCQGQQTSMHSCLSARPAPLPAFMPSTSRTTGGPVEMGQHPRKSTLAVVISPTCCTFLQV